MSNGGKPLVVWFKYGIKRFSASMICEWKWMKLQTLNESCHWLTMIQMLLNAQGFLFHCSDDFKKMGWLLQSPTESLCIKTPENWVAKCFLLTGVSSESRGCQCPCEHIFCLGGWDHPNERLFMHIYIYIVCQSARPLKKTWFSGKLPKCVKKPM